MNKIRALSIGVMLSLFCSCSFAVDVSSGSYIALPPGTAAAVLYDISTRSSEFKTDDGSVIKDGTSFKAHLNILKFAYFTEIGGYTVAPEILLPYGEFSDAKLGGQPLGQSKGWFDPMFAMTTWIINEPNSGPAGRYLSVTPILTVPAGSYDHNKRLNVGENRYKLETHVNWVEPLWGKNYLDITGELALFGDNDEAGAGNQTLKQDSSVTVHAYINHVINPSQTIALGYTTGKGGKQFVDNVYTGLKTDYGQARLEFIQYFNRSTGLSLSFRRDLYVEGGFKQDLGVTAVGWFAF